MNQDHQTVITLALAALLSGLRASPLNAGPPEFQPNLPLHQVPGVVINHSPASSGIYIGSPSIAVLPNGRYVVSHDLFGPGTSADETLVFGSADHGQTWKKIATIKGQWWSTLFVHREALYILGTSRENGFTVIRRSLDDGHTWTVPTDATNGLLLGNGRYHCAPVPVVIHRGRLWRAMENAMGPGGWGSHFQAFMMSAPVDADLLRAESWTFSNPLRGDPTWLQGGFGGWLEGNAVVAPDGQVLDVLRVDTPGFPEKVALVGISPDGRISGFDPQKGFINFPGGAKKFTIRFDARSGLYWTLATIPPTADQSNQKPASLRNTLALTCSPDLTNWTVRTVLLHHPDTAKVGFQYVDWQFEGDDLIAVCRTAFDDGLGGAHTYHDANFLTFHRLKSFRQVSAAAVGPAIRVYSHPFDPRENPDYARHAVHAPSWDLFGHQTQFTSLRGFEVQGDQLVHYTDEIEKYTQKYQLGNVLWPSYPILFATNLADLAREVKRRDLFLFDVWGYVPGSGPGGYWQQFKPPAMAFTTLESILRERWLGADIGEQDGRYIGGYASQMFPISTNRFEQYLNFQRHFERMGNDLGNKLSALVSLNFGHYLVKEGTYTFIGAETAQALPNSQVYYAFIRGAGKQYGVPWFGNASIYNRWGFKTYGSEGVSDGTSHGPTWGTSLSLMKRLLYSHICYNSMIVGFENGWFEGDHLSPIGRIQQAAQRWVRENRTPGVMHTPVALLLDFYSGWSFPRHLYTDKLYRVWGNVPYGVGDYLTDGVLGLIYPGYQDSSYFHDETGFLTPTPYGDVADCLLSDAPAWLLDRYPVVVVAGALSGGTEIRQKLADYVSHGGQLVITAGNLAKLPGGLAGVEVGSGPGTRGLTNAILVNANGTLSEPPFDILSLSVPPQARVLARSASGEPLTVQVQDGKGQLTVFASEFGIANQPRRITPLVSRDDQHLPTPYPLLAHVREVLDPILREQELFTAGPDLSLITCRLRPGEYTLYVANNSWEAKPLQLRSQCGQIQSLEELLLDQSERTAVGLTPRGFEHAQLGTNDATNIAGGDVRIFRIRVQESKIEEIPHVVPPARTTGRWLALRSTHSLKEQILSRPTFFEHFDGVLLDWRYLQERDIQEVKQEAPWMARQKLRVAVDLTSGLNLYPDLRLIDNDQSEYAESATAIAELLQKMRLIGARDLVVSLHRHPENNFTGEQTTASFEKALQQLTRHAAEFDITIHLRLAPNKPPWSIADAVRMIERVGASNLRLAPSTALILDQKIRGDLIKTIPPERLGLWLLSAPDYDAAGKAWTYNRPLAFADCERLSPLIKPSPRVPWVLDAVFANSDEEYQQITLLERQLGH